MRPAAVSTSSTSASAMRFNLKPPMNADARRSAFIGVHLRFHSLFLAIVCPALLGAGVATREEALAMAYPGASIRSEIVFLTDQERREAAKKAGVEIPSSLIARYVADRDGKVVGRAYVDTHQVRTKRESLLILLDEKGTVKRIEVTAFLEPPEYQASPSWYAQYED